MKMRRVPALDRQSFLRQNARKPVCPQHGCECLANRTEIRFTRYYCPIDGCAFSQKIARPVG